MKVAVIGSRRYRLRTDVEAVIDGLPKNAVVVSGGCAGPDTWAVERAEARGMKTLVFRPKTSGMQTHLDLILRYYDRNRKIAEAADIIYAFLPEGHSGGTDNTIKWAKKFKKKIIIKREGQSTL